MTSAPGSFDGSTEPSPAAADQAQLRRLAASQDEQAWAELHQRLGPTLIAVARRLTRAAGHAEDAVQQTFLQLFRARAAFARAETPLAYALRALRHTLARQAPRISAPLPDDDSVAAAPIADVERAPELERALAALPFEQREALELKLEYGDGMRGPPVQGRGHKLTVCRGARGANPKERRPMKKRSERKNVAAAAKTIGLDLGDQTSQVCVLDAGGEVIEEFTVPTTRSAIEREFRAFAPGRVVLETGTHANWIHDVLVSTGHEAVVANARKVRAISANERKSDVRDARMLARLGRVDVKLLDPVTVRAEDVRLDLMLVRARAAAVESRTQRINAVRGLAKAAGHRLASCSTSCFHKQALPATLDPALRGLIASIEQLSKTIHHYDEKIEALAHEEYPQTKLLTQISGVGDLTALTFVLTLGDTARFESGRDVGAFFGLVPGRDQSGGRDPQMRTPECGDAMVRTLLVQCAHRVLSTRAPDTDLRRFGEKLAARGGKAAQKRAVVATARKLAVLMFALLRNGEVYEPLRNSAAPTTP